MRLHSAALLILLAAVSGQGQQDANTRARELESKGDGWGARTLLQQAANHGEPGAARDYAEFLDRHKDPAAREAYRTAIAAADGRESRIALARRLVLLDLIAGDYDSASKDLERYREYGGAEFSGSVKVPPASEAGPVAVVQIPGPIRSFSRMAALSPDLMPKDVLTALARNVVTNGYQASSSNEALEQTEYLKLVVRYLSQARELEKLAGAGKTIRIEQCESAEAADILRVLGYRMRGACGGDVVLETVNATRAFLTIDSGFPLAELEQALRTNRPFVYDYRPTEVPVLFGPEYWLSSRDKQGGVFIDVFLSDPSVCRLYLGLSKLDRETAEVLRKQMPAQKIRVLSHVIDFFGGMFQIRNGKAIVPGGAPSAKGWSDLVGESPDSGGAFFEKLIARDDGWMASYFDALARVDGPLQAYLTEPERMKRFYSALRGRVTSPGPARPVFRSNTDLMLLTTRLRVDSQGRAVIPGSIDVWKNLFINHPHGKYDGKLTRLATSWKEPDDVVEALFALCRKAVDNEPLKIFMALSDMDRRRTTPMRPETVDRLAREYRTYGAQYSLLNELPTLSDRTINAFLDTAKEISQIGNNELRADTAGTMQALAGLWQIFCRQRAISPDAADEALFELLAPFGRMREEYELFAAGVSGIKVLLKATGSTGSESPQDRMIALLAGSPSPADTDSHRQVVQDMMRIFEAQRLVSITSLMDLSEHLDRIAQGERLNTALVNRIVSRVSEINLPRASLSTAERNAFAFGYWTEKHIDNQRKLNLRAVIEKAGTDAEKLREVRGELAGFLRDTLVGFNYMHYAPPGAQVLYTNPLFVRSHDFLGMQGSVQTWRQTEVLGTGWPSSAGGRLVGSLSGLPYALAEAEQNFLVPTREQALIWGDLVPQMILSSKIPRWWNVSPSQVHWLALHLQYAESLLAESALNAEMRNKVLAELDKQAVPARVSLVDRLLEEGRVREALDNVTPSEAYGLSIRMLRTDAASGPIAVEIREMAKADPEHINYRAVSRAFGTPKPTLANSYNPELLNLRTFPTLMGYSSRIMAESWESSMLYYAALADEMHLLPSQLNVLVPEWTQKTVEQIFATHLEDWPALLRSLRHVGDEFRARTRKQFAAEQKASLE